MKWATICQMENLLCRRQLASWEGLLCREYRNRSYRCCPLRQSLKTLPPKPPDHVLAWYLFYGMMERGYEVKPAVDYEPFALPGMVLSRMKPMRPATNMLVSRSTSKIWSRISAPVSKASAFSLTHWGIICKTKYDEILLAQSTNINCNTTSPKNKENPTMTETTKRMKNQ